jgi:hypothetical protein
LAFEINRISLHYSLNHRLDVLDLELGFVFLLFFGLVENLSQQNRSFHSFQFF